MRLISRGYGDGHLSQFICLKAKQNAQPQAWLPVSIRDSWRGLVCRCCLISCSLKKTNLLGKMVSGVAGGTKIMCAPGLHH